MQGRETFPRSLVFGSDNTAVSMAAAQGSDGGQKTIIHNSNLFKITVRREDHPTLSAVSCKGYNFRPSARSILLSQCESFKGNHSNHNSLIVGYIWPEAKA